MKRDDKEIEKLLNKAQEHSSYGNHSKAIQCLEQARKIVQMNPFLSDKYMPDILWPLGNLYGVNKQYDKAAEVEEIELDSLLELCNSEPPNSAKLEEDIASRIVSICLCLGTAYANLEEFDKAKERYVLGYAMSFFNFGEYDEKTLKQLFNWASLEMLHGDTNEGTKQLMYCYYDMLEHLGESNYYTQHAKDVLTQAGKDMDKEYSAFVELKKASKTIMDAYLQMMPYEYTKGL